MSLKKNGESPWLAAALMAALIFIVYAPALRAGFIWDDDVHLTENPCITGLQGFGDIWMSSHAVYYPLVLTTFWIAHKFVGLNPLPYHLLNVLMHTAAAILLWRVLRQLRVHGAWLGAMLWALHPVTVESVAWITELKNTQSGFFYLLSILFFLTSDEIETDSTERRGRYALSLVFFALAITSKPATAMLPVALGLCLWWRNRLRWRHVAVLAPFFFVSAVASAWTTWEQKFHAGAVGAEWSETWLQRLAIAGCDIWFYLGKLVWPHPLIFIYPRWKIDIYHLATFVPLLAAVACLLFLWWKRNGPLRPAFFAAAYFVALLFPVLGFFNVYFFRYSLVSDHFQYLASIGPLALAGSGVVTAFRAWKKNKPWLGAIRCGALLLIVATLSSLHVGMFRDLETLWRATLARNPDCWLAHTNLGVVLKAQGKDEEAVAHYRAALNLKPDFAEALTSLGSYQAGRGEIESALTNFQAALSSAPNFPPALFNLGKALIAQGKIDNGIAAYQAAVRAWPAYFEARTNLGIALSQSGKQEEAVEHLREALRIKPNDIAAHNNLGVVLTALQRFDDAVLQFRETLRLDPLNAPAYINLARALAQSGHREEAIHELQEVLRIKPDYPEAKRQLRELGVSMPE